MTSPSPSRYWLALGVLTTGVFGLIALEPMVDDAFIVFRYVHRILNGHGFTFNDTEHVEGTTSLLWTCLLLLGTKMSAPPTTAILINLFLVATMPVALDALLSTLAVRIPLRLLALGLFSISLLFFKVVFLGLEFGLYILLLLLLLRALLLAFDFPRFDRPKPRLALVAGLLAGLLFLTRPESLLLLPGFTVLIVLSSRKPASTRNLLGIAWGTFALAVLAVTWWRLSYFGSPIPNSVVAKSALPAIIGGDLKALFFLLADSLVYLGSAYFQHPALFLTALIATYVLVQQRAPMGVATVMLPIAVQHVVIMLNGGDWMPYFRLLYSHVPVFIVLFAQIAQDWAGKKWLAHKALIFLVSFLFVTANAYALRFDTSLIKAAFGRAGDVKWPEGELYAVLGRKFEAQLPPGLVVAPEAIGRIGVEAPSAYIHDQTGLTDKRLARDAEARRSVYGRTNWAYTMSLSPDVLVQHFWPAKLTPLMGSYEVYCVGPYQVEGEGVWLFLVIRRDRGPVFKPILEELGHRGILASAHASLQGSAGDYCTALYD